MFWKTTGERSKVMEFYQTHLLMPDGMGLVLCQTLDCGWPEIGGKHQECEAPEGPFRLLVSDTFFADCEIRRFGVCLWSVKKCGQA